MKPVVPLRILFIAALCALPLLSGAQSLKKWRTPGIYNAARQQGRTYLYITLPYVNFFSFRPAQPDVHCTKAGIPGVGLAVEHFYADRWALRGEYSAVCALPLSWSTLLLIDERSYHEFTWQQNFALVNSYNFERLAIGAGPNLSQDGWEYEYLGSEENGDHPRYNLRRDANDRYWTLGVHLDAFLTYRNFRIGAVYRPSFYRLGAHHGLSYEHSTSIDMRWRINLGKPLHARR